MATTLATLVEHLESTESLEIPDQVLPIRGVRMDEAGTLETPAGRAVLTDWSRRQLSSLMGIRWDRWFDRAGPGERAGEINSRLARMDGSARVRLRCTRRVPEGADADITIQAVVSPTYTAVPDSRVARVLRDVLRGAGTRAEVQRVMITDKTVSYAVMIGEPQMVGGIVGTVWGGLVVCNSGWGYASLTVRAFLHRLVCENGMIVVYPGSQLVRRRHRAIDLNALEVELRAGMAKLPGGLAHTVALLERSTGTRVDSVHDEIERVLRDARLPLRHAPPILTAFQREPSPTAFAVTQAISAYARDQAPEDRELLERAAGSYVAALGDG
jgi:hypothetical protein